MLSPRNVNSLALGLSFAAIVALSIACGKSADLATTPPASHAGMIFIEGGEFEMGSPPGPRVQADESPPHRVRVSSFWLDKTEVTNAEFARFVAATHYVTTAERAPDWDELKKQLPPGTPRPTGDAMRAGSLVFVAPPETATDPDPGTWWKWTPGADWRHPEGPASTIDGRENHPVVHVSYDDALAYCAFVHKRLPTEAEWEFAARGGSTSGEPSPIAIGASAANTWQGSFPYHNTSEDGFTTTAPVGSFPPNARGLVDMAGNVWEWCADWYRADAYAQDVEASTRSGSPIVDPQGPKDSFDPQEPLARKRVQRGGSFLCHSSYCCGYRATARMKCTPDTSLEHTGFRCAVTADSDSR